ncbi:hypothetical protein [Rhodococcoides fascians]|uniref:hypothetical protein n=1 Tax=Rhodococcoides fascians TaxID=1828 RepID=UPI00050C6F49|nr:hypothetical protein [Rhodococcus fascians]
MAVEVVSSEGPSEVPVQTKSTFYQVEGIRYRWIVEVVARTVDSFTIVLVHAELDAHGLTPVPATVIRSND